MLDASIPLRVQAPQMPDQFNALARALQIGGAMDEQKMNAMTMREKERGIAEQQSVNALWQAATGADGTIDRTKLISGLAQGGMGHRIGAMQEQFTKQDEQQAKLAKDRAEEARKSYAVFQNGAAALARDPNLTPQGAADYFARLVSAGVVQPGVAAHIMRGAPQDPQQLSSHLNYYAQSAISPEKQLELFAPKPDKVDTGQQILTRDNNPLSPTFGQQIGGAAVQKVATPDAQLSATTSTANNQRTVGAMLSNAAATREVASATRDAAGIKDKRDAEMKLADDWRTQSKGYKEVEDAAARVKSALATATKSAPATLSAATSFMKLLDPSSVVRESELVMALQASGALDRAMNSFNILQNGKVLTQQQAAEFGKVTDTLLQAARQQQQKVDSFYRSAAEKNGLRPDMVIQSLGQSAPQGGGEQSVLDAADRILRGGR